MSSPSLKNVLYDLVDKEAVIYLPATVVGGKITSVSDDAVSVYTLNAASKLASEMVVKMDAIIAVQPVDGDPVELPPELIRGPRGPGGGGLIQ